MKIVSYLIGNKNHPTVDEIYSALKPSMPTLSKTTVYSTVKLLVDKGFLLPLFIDENEVRYDPDVSVHAHFKCRKCGDLHDVQASVQKIYNKEGHLIENTHIYFTGICFHCKK